MNAVFRVVTRIQDQDDFSGSLTNGQFLKYNSSTNSFELQSVSPGGNSGQLQYNDSSSFAGVNHSSIGITGDIFKLSSLAIGDIPLVIKGFAGQTGNLSEWRDESNNVLASINPSGMITASKITSTYDAGGFNAAQFCGPNSTALYMDQFGQFAFSDATKSRFGVSLTSFHLPSDGEFGISSGNVFGTVTNKLSRGSTGPTWDLRATGGIRSRTLDNSADAPITGSTLTASGRGIFGGATPVAGIDSAAFPLVSNFGVMANAYSRYSAYMYIEGTGGAKVGAYDYTGGNYLPISLVGSVVGSYADSGFKVRNRVDSADAALTCGAITASGAVTTSTISTTATSLRFDSTTTTDYWRLDHYIPGGSGGLQLLTSAGTPRVTLRGRSDMQWLKFEASSGVSFIGAGRDSSGEGVSNGFKFTDYAAGGGVTLIASNNSGVMDPILRWGGTTSSYPAIKRSGTTTAFRLGDDSADGPITCGAITASGNITLAAGATISNGYGSQLTIGNTSNLLRLSAHTLVIGYNGGFTDAYFDPAFAVWRVKAAGGYALSSTTSALGTVDAEMRRGGTALIDLRADNGLRVRNLANSADAALTCGAITASGAIFAGGDVRITAGDLRVDAGQVMYWSSRSILASPADGNIRLTNNAQTSFGLLQLGGTTSSFPAIKRSGTTTAFRLADDSADGPISCGAITASSTIQVSPSISKAMQFTRSTTNYSFEIGTSNDSLGWYDLHNSRYVFRSTTSNFLINETGALRTLINTGTDDGVNALQVAGNSAFAGAIMASGASTSSVGEGAFSHGFGALGDRAYMQSFASGIFAADGDAQAVRFICRGKTLNATPVSLAMSYGGTTLLTIPSGKTMSANVMVSGIKSDGSAKCTFFRKIVITNVGGTTTLDAEIKEFAARDNPLTDVVISADDVNDALNISVTGIAGETWRWVAVVEGLEIAYGT